MIYLNLIFLVIWLYFQSTVVTQYHNIFENKDNKEWENLLFLFPGSLES